MKAIASIDKLGQQIWLDNLSREILVDGELAGLIGQGVSGITTNPAIFKQAICHGQHYADALRRLQKEMPDSASARYERLVIADVQAACNLLATRFTESSGSSGYVSLEVDPALADDALGTVVEARRLAAAVERANLLIKIPATAAGLQALETLTLEGVSTNVTLIFSLQQAAAVRAAWLRGLAQRHAAGLDLGNVFSVASLFLSRTDSALDAQLPAALQGRTALALAKVAYAQNCAFFAAGNADFAPILAAGGRPQRLLWASTSSKNPAYGDLHYVLPLVGADTISTLPPATLAAVGQYAGQWQPLRGDSAAEAEAELAAVESSGVDLAALGERLQQDGLRQFEAAFAELMATVGD